MSQYAGIELNGTPCWLPEDKFEIEIDPLHWFLLCCGTCFEIFEGIRGVLAAKLCGWSEIEKDDCDLFTHTGLCAKCKIIQKRNSNRIWLNL